MASILTTKDIVKQFGAFRALDGVNVDVERPLYKSFVKRRFCKVGALFPKAHQKQTKAPHQKHTHALSTKFSGNYRADSRASIRALRYSGSRDRYLCAVL
jgi:hypothetical protein